jgi:hypothetical protein
MTFVKGTISLSHVNIYSFLYGFVARLLISQRSDDGVSNGSN